MLFIGAVWEALNHWSLLDSVITKLRSEGSAGILLANAIVSPLLRLVLILGGFVIVAKPYIDRRKTKAAPLSRGRVVVDVTPEYLTDLFRGLTSIQAHKLAAVYIGKWMTMAGRVADVASVSARCSSVTFDRPLIGPFVHTFFRTEEWIDRVSFLKPGDSVTVVGRIGEVASAGVYLDDCELV